MFMFYQIVTSYANQIQYFFLALSQYWLLPHCTMPCLLFFSFSIGFGNIKYQEGFDDVNRAILLREYKAKAVARHICNSYFEYQKLFSYFEYLQLHVL